MAALSAREQSLLRGPVRQVAAAAAAGVGLLPKRDRRRSSPRLSEVIDNFAVLERAPVFWTLPDRLLRVLARRMRPLRLPPQTGVSFQGDLGESLFLVQEGRCLIRIEQIPGHQMTVGQLARGDFFGEVALLDEPNYASLWTAGEATLLSLDLTTLGAVLNSEPETEAQLRSLARQRRSNFEGMSLRASWGRGSGDGEVLAFYSAKGGSGRSTITLNVAAMLAQRHPGDVILLDLSFPYNHLALMANLIPTGSLGRLAGEPHETFEDALLSAVLYHTSGLMVLPGALRPEESDLVRPDLVERAIETLRSAFRYVVVDLGVSISDPVLAVFDKAQQVFLVACPEIAAIDGTAEMRQILHEVIGLSEERIHLVLNNRAPSASIKKDALERSLKSEVAVEIRYDGSRPDAAALRGQILSLQDAKSEIALGARELVKIVEAQTEAAHSARSHRPLRGQRRQGTRMPFEGVE
jgi:Flp pilus assembly CpaE family ATPase